MEHDPYPPAEFMEEGEPLFDWEEDLMAKRRAAYRSITAGLSADPVAAEDEPRAFSLWDRIRRAI